MPFLDVFSPLQIISLLGHKYCEERIEVLNKIKWICKSLKDMRYFCFYLWTLIFLRHNSTTCQRMGADPATWKQNLQLNGSLNLASL